MDRAGTRSTWEELQEGQTRGFWSRSAAIRISASGARYSLMPRRPTVGPSGGVWWHGSRYPTSNSNLSKPSGGAKVCAAGARGDSHMHASVRVAGLMLALATVAQVQTARAQATHVVRLVVN